MPFQPGANLYTQGFGSKPEAVEVPHLDVRIPNTSDWRYPVGKRWLDTVSGDEYVLASLSNTGNVTTATWTLLGSGGTLNTLTTDDSNVVTPSSGNINLFGDGSITTVGSGDTATVELTGLTDHNVMVGAGTTTITMVAPSATAGIALVSAGAAADPAFDTVVVAGGGTGAVTLTGVLTGNGTSAVTANAVTEHGVIVAGAANAVASLAVASTGTVLAGSTGADPAFTGSPSVSGSVTAGTSITATAGDITATLGNVIINGAAKQLRCHGGAVTDFIGQATLTLGTVTVLNTNIAATDRIFVTRSDLNGSTALGVFDVSITASTSFTIDSRKTTDASVETNDISIVDYFIVRQV